MVIPNGWLGYLAPELITSLRIGTEGNTDMELPFTAKSDVYAFGYVKRSGLGKCQISWEFHQNRNAFLCMKDPIISKNSSQKHNFPPECNISRSRCDTIKGNESDDADIVFEILTKKESQPFLWFMLF